LGQGIAALQKAVADKGNRLILRRGAAIDVIPKLVEETGATAVYWQRPMIQPARRVMRR